MPVGDKSIGVVRGVQKSHLPTPHSTSHISTCHINTSNCSTFVLIAPSAILGAISCLQHTTPHFRPTDRVNETLIKRRRVHERNAQFLGKKIILARVANASRLRKNRKVTRKVPTFVMCGFFFTFSSPVSVISRRLHAISVCMKLMHEIYYGDTCYFCPSVGFMHHNLSATFVMHAGLQLYLTV